MVRQRSGILNLSQKIENNMDGPGRNTRWINSRSADRPPQRQQPAIDKEVSKIVGKEVRVNDPRLIKIVSKWREGSNFDNINKNDNHLNDSAKVADLKKAFSESVTV